MSKLQRYILHRQDRFGGWGTDLDSVLSLLILMNTGYAGPAIARGLRLLLTRQDADGSWMRAPLFRDLRPHYYGSSSLTTALCAEALFRFGSG
jgi:hypothetical protein